VSVATARGMFLVLALAAAHVTPRPVRTPSPPSRPSPPSPAPVAPRPADPIRAEYEAAIAPGLADSCATRLTHFLALHPRSPWAYAAELELGQLHYAKGDYAAAREHFRHAHGGASLDEARWWEGLSSFALGRPREARDAVSTLAHDRHGAPRQWDATYLVALSYAQEGDKPQALAAYRELLGLPAGTGQAAALYQAERLAHDLARPDEALSWGKRLLADYADSPEAASLRAEETRAHAEAEAARAAAPTPGPATPQGPATPPAPAPAKSGR
jgi:tetratricopeptide (TPR) repeat protein